MPFLLLLVKEQIPFNSIKRAACNVHACNVWSDSYRSEEFCESLYAEGQEKTDGVSS